MLLAPRVSPISCYELQLCKEQQIIIIIIIIISGGLRGCRVPLTCKRTPLSLLLACRLT